MKTKTNVEDVVDIVHNVFRCSGFALRAFLRNRTAPACSSSYQAGSWLDAPVTLEQLRIERYLDTTPLEDKCLLHAGVGASTIALKFHHRCRHIDGITVMEEELQHAEALGISNYKVYLVDKYSDKIAALGTRYHYIIDSNLSSFTAERAAFEAMVERYVMLLEKGGMILTDRFGMHFHEHYSFGIDDEDLIAFEQVLPIQFKKINRTIRALVKV